MGFPQLSLVLRGYGTSMPPQLGQTLSAETWLIQTSTNMIRTNIISLTLMVRASRKTEDENQLARDKRQELAEKQKTRNNWREASAYLYKFTWVTCICQEIIKHEKEDTKELEEINNSLKEHKNPIKERNQQRIISHLTYLCNFFLISFLTRSLTPDPCWNEGIWGEESNMLK